MSDLISRQAAIEIVERYNKSHMVLKQRPMLGAASIVIELEELPSAQPEHKRGKWMLADMYESTHKAMLCNKCNAAYDMTIVGGMFNYCPHCGADMRGE